MDTEEDEGLFTVSKDGDLLLNINSALEKQEAFLSSQDLSKRHDLVHKFLGFHMGLLGLPVKDGQHQTPIRTTHSIHPVSFGPLTSLTPSAISDLKIRCLQTLCLLFKKSRKSRVFAFWYVLLPDCAFNPCKKGILELVLHRDFDLREKALDLLLETFTGSATHLQLANAHCRTSSFTPVCLEFAHALGR